MSATTVRLSETRTIINQSAFTGADSQPVQVISGSRMLVSLLVTAIDPGASITLYIDNSFASDVPYDTIDNLSLNVAGSVKRIYSDYHNQFNFRYQVNNGNADFKVAITLSDNAGTTTIENAQLSVNLDHTVDALGHFDSVRIGDGTELLKINPDGSLPVTVGDAPDESVISVYSEVSSVVNGSDTSILTYTVPVDKTSAFIVYIDVSGENIAKYDVYLNGTRIARKRTYFGGNLNETFTFGSQSKNGYPLEPGDIIEVKALHSRPFNGDFEARLQAVVKD